jgi:hypothetical protein
MRLNRKHIVAVVIAGIAGLTLAASAAWSASAVGSAHAQAGKLGVSVNGSGKATFTQSTDASYYGGESRIYPFTVLNTGDFAETMGTTVSNSNPGCFTATTLLAPGNADTDDTAGDYDSGQGGNGTLTITANGLDNTCQGLAADIMVTVTGTQSSSPRG